MVRHGSRAGWYELTRKFKWTTVSPGALVRWLGPGDYLAIAVKDSDGKARLYERSADIGSCGRVTPTKSALDLRLPVALAALRCL